MSWTPPYRFSFIALSVLLCTLFSVKPVNAQFGDTQRVINVQSQGANVVRSADLDGDGDLDVVSASPDDNKIAWYENLDSFGSFGFQEVISFEALRVNTVECADLDQDGDIDILAASRDDNTVGWFRNNGNGTFSNRIAITTDAFVAMSVYAADFDGDNDLDVVSASRDDDKIAWYENLDGSGLFGTQQIISSAALRAFAVYAADLDGDGDQDIVSASELDDKIAWYENLDGNGTFSTQQIISTEVNSAHDVHAGDLDGDGDFDIIAASSADDAIVWFENVDGGGTFGPANEVTDAARFAQDVYAADIDQDGDLDLLSASINDSKVAWYPNIDGKGTFGPQVVISTSASGATSVFVANLDGDEDLDVLSSSMFDNKIAWYESFLGKGRVRFSFMNEISVDGQLFAPHSVHAADLDGDNDPDIISASLNDDKVSWYKNNNGVIGRQQVISGAADGARDVHTADLDGDGDLDILSASGFDNSIKWYENFDGRGSFDVLQVITTDANNAYAVYSGDLDGDGDTDVVSASFDDNTIAWYENLDGTGLFSGLIPINKTARGATDVTVADLDGDGDQDVVSASTFDDKIAWYRNTDGQGNFGGSIVISDEADLAIAVHTADVDNDGDIDVLSASSNDNKIAWYENLDGAGVFSRAKIITLEARQAFSVYTADLDNDGDLDVLSASRDDDRIAWHENLGEGRFGVPQAITTSALGARSVFAADLDLDGDPDVLVASQGDNRLAWYENLSIISTVLDVEDGPEGVNEYDWSTAIYPNPSRSTVNLRFSADRSQHVFAAVYDIQGRQIEVLHDGFIAAHTDAQIAFQPDRLASGIYIVRIQGERFVQSEKIVLIR